MKTHWLAGACALALVAFPAALQAQSASPSDPAQSQMQSGQSDQTAQAAPGMHAGAEMLGKKVKLQSGETVGEISDVLVKDGKPTEAVVELDKQKDKPVMITITSLSPQGGDYVLSMTEAQLAQAPEFKGPQSGQTSLQEQQAKGQSGTSTTTPSQRSQ